MSELYQSLNDDLRRFIEAQPIFFVATAPEHGRINLSPKGSDTLRIVDDNQVQWLNLTGSGNETSAHIAENNRMTMMMCSFDKQPLILRLYGKATEILHSDSQWDEHIAKFPPFTGARQIFALQIELVQTSCGYAVPHMELLKERKTLDKWADGRGRDGIREYWQAKNSKSIDDKPINI